MTSDSVPPAGWEAVSEPRLRPIQQQRRSAPVGMEIYGVGPIPKPGANAPPQQWLDYGLVVSLLHASDRSDVPVKEVASAYLEKWHDPT